MATSSAPASGIAVARHLKGVLGGQTRVERFYDEREQNDVDVLTADDWPEPGWTTCSTVTLHTSSNLLDEQDVRVELMATARTADTEIANVIATAAFYVAKDGWLAAPGVVFPGLVQEYFPETTTPHVMWSEPTNLPQLGTVGIDGVGDVHWLLAVPLSEPEREFLVAEGFYALEERLASAAVPYFDLRRPSVV